MRRLPRTIHSTSFRYRGRSRDDAVRRLPRTITPRSRSSIRRIRASAIHSVYHFVTEEDRATTRCVVYRVPSTPTWAKRFSNASKTSRVFLPPTVPARSRSIRDKNDKQKPPREHARRRSFCLVCIAPGMHETAASVCIYGLRIQTPRYAYRIQFVHNFTRK